LSKLNESRMIDSNDKMYFFQLEFPCVKTTFRY